VILAGAATLALVLSNPDTAAVEQFDTEVHAIHEALNLPGLVIVVRRSGEVVYERALGHADPEGREAITTDHLFWAASVTKSATAYLILREGRDLTTPWSEWSGEAVPFHPETTLAHLVTQTGEGPSPGSGFLYGSRFNSLIDLWGELNTFREALNQVVFNSLGVTATASPGRGGMDVPEVTPLRRAGQGWIADDAARWPGALPATNMQITPHGLARFGEALNRCEGLTEVACGTLNNAFILNDGSPSPYGFGAFVEDVGSVRVFWQYGFGQAESALLVRSPDLGLSVAVLSNSADLSAAARLGAGDLIRHQLGPAILQTWIAPQAGIDWEGERELNAVFAELPALEACDEAVSQALLKVFDDHPAVFSEPTEQIVYILANDFRGYGGDDGIRTHDTLLRYTPLAGERLRPLGHVSTDGFSRPCPVRSSRWRGSGCSLPCKPHPGR
jgi:CubicO group peptidase (beta-lactamase class C family)